MVRSFQEKLRSKSSHQVGHGQLLRVEHRADGIGCVELLLPEGEFDEIHQCNGEGVGHSTAGAGLAALHPTQSWNGLTWCEFRRGVETGVRLPTSTLADLSSFHS